MKKTVKKKPRSRKRKPRYQTPKGHSHTWRSFMKGKLRECVTCYEME